MHQVRYFWAFSWSLLLLLGSNWLPAQSNQILQYVLSAAGDSVGAGAFSAQFVLGESFILEAENGPLHISEGFLQPSLLALISGVDQDSVWPGDANLDGTANIYDLFPIGLAYGASGPLRPGASLVWTPQAAPPWSGQFVSGVNHRHADGDGSGLIDANDTLPIVLNYGLTHNKGAGGAQTGPALAVVLSADSLQTGDTLRIDLLLGSDTVPVPAIYGIAFSLDFDTTLVQASSLQVRYDTSWLGTPGTDLLTLTYPYAGQGTIDMGLIRTDQTNRAGAGRIAHLTLIMIDDLGGKTPLREQMAFSIVGLQALSVDEAPVIIQSQDDTLWLGEGPTGIGGSDLLGVYVYPNPAHDWLTIDLPPAVVAEGRLFDPLGRLVHVQKGMRNTQRWTLSSLAPGLYVIQVRSAGRQAIRKIWIH